jgi:hypothetical protein
MSDAINQDVFYRSFPIRLLRFGMAWLAPHPFPTQVVCRLRDTPLSPALPYDRGAFMTTTIEKLQVQTYVSISS